MAKNATPEPKDGQVLVLVNKRHKKNELQERLSHMGLSHFIFSDGKESFFFVSRDEERIGKISDFILDELEEEIEDIDD